MVSVRTAERVAIAALVMILFDGGQDIGWRKVRGALAPVLSVGLIGAD